jgi:hypothetical protein
MKNSTQTIIVRIVLVLGVAFAIYGGYVAYIVNQK